MIIYIYDDEKGKTNALSIDKENVADEELEFSMTTVFEKSGTPVKKNGIFRSSMSYRY